MALRSTLFLLPRTQVFARDSVTRRVAARYLEKHLLMMRCMGRGAALFADSGALGRVQPRELNSLLLHGLGRRGDGIGQGLGPRPACSAALQVSGPRQSVPHDLSAFYIAADASGRLCAEQRSIARPL